MSIWASFFTLTEEDPLGAPWEVDYSLEKRMGGFDVAKTTYFRGLRVCMWDAHDEVALDEQQVRALRDALSDWLERTYE